MQERPVGGSSLAAAPDGKITPDMMQVILLDELVGRFARHVDSITPGGRRFGLVILVSAIQAPVEFEAFAWTMFNDGPNQVYTANGRNAVVVDGTQPALLPAESETLDLHRRTWVSFSIACQPGQTATVRIRGIV